MKDVVTRRESLLAVCICLAGLDHCAHAQTRVARAQGRRNAGWPDERRSGNLICHSTFPLDRVQGAIHDLATLQGELTDALGTPASQEPAHVFLFHNRAFYESYVRRHFPTVGRRQALFVKENGGPGMIFVYYHRDVEVDLRHESTHALLHAVLPMVPLWLDEGIAEYFEVSPKRRERGNPHLRSVKWEARLGRVSDLRDLEKLASMEEMNAGDYRDAWAWVHFMLHGSPAARDELQKFLGDIAAHRPPGVLSERIRRRIPDANSRYLAHFRKW